MGHGGGRRLTSDFSESQPDPEVMMIMHDAPRDSVQNMHWQAALSCPAPPRGLGPVPFTSAYSASMHKEGQSHI